MLFIKYHILELLQQNHFEIMEDFMHYRWHDVIQPHRPTLWNYAMCETTNLLG